MSILLGLLPALAWGVLPLAVAKIGGKTANQIFGTTAGTFLVAFFVFIYSRPEIILRDFVLCMLSGMFWVIGQSGQFSAYARIGVSKTMPISSALQLIGTSLIGVFVFGEWAGTQNKFIGFGALFLVVLGVALTSTKDDSSTDSVDKKTLLMLFVTNFGFLAYSSIPAVVTVSGAALFLPQALGMVIAASLYLLFTGQKNEFKTPTSWHHLISGFIFSVAALTYILSAHLNGIATGFILAQLSVVIATLGGIFILKENKSKKQFIAIIIGLVLIVLGEVIVATI